MTLNHTPEKKTEKRAVAQPDKKYSKFFKELKSLFLRWYLQYVTESKYFFDFCVLMLLKKTH